MKRLYILLLGFGLMIACTDTNISDQGFNLKVLPAYVAFNAPGENAIMDDIEVDENAGSVSLNIEAPTGTLSDITVDYTFGGDAVFGTDFDVSGATANGGSIVLKVDPTDVQDFDNVDLDIDILTDGATDGDKTLTVTIVGGVNADGDMFVGGRGGTDFLKTATIKIADVDCASDLTGTYSTLTDGTSGTAFPYTVTITESATVNGEYTFSDITGGLYAIGYSAADQPAIVNDNCGVLSLVDQPDTVFGNDLFNGTGTVNADGTLTLTWSNGFGDFGTTTFTKN